MGVGAAQLPGGVVHQLHKTLYTAGNMDGQRVGGVIARPDEQIAHQIHEGDLLPPQQIAGRALLIQPIDGLSRHGDHVLRIAVFQRHQRGEQLGGGGGIQLHIGVLLQQDGVGAALIQNGALGRHLMLWGGCRQRRHTAENSRQQQTKNFFHHLFVLPVQISRLYGNILAKARRECNRDFARDARIQNFLRNGVCA